MFLFRQEGGRGFKTHLTVFHQTLKSWRQTPSQAAAPALHRPAAQARLHPHSHSQGGKAPVPSDFPTVPQTAAPSLQLAALQRGLTPLPVTRQDFWGIGVWHQGVSRASSSRLGSALLGALRPSPTMVQERRGRSLTACLNTVSRHSWKRLQEALEAYCTFDS